MSRGKPRVNPEGTTSGPLESANRGSEDLPRAPFAVGVVGMGVAAVLATFSGGAQRFFQAYLVSYAFVLSLALGSLFFVLIQHLTRAGWSVTVRRLAEIGAATIPALAALFVPLLFALALVYPWASGAAGDPLTVAKRPYLNAAFFILRWIVYFAVWTWLSRGLLGASLRQDRTGDPAETLRAERISGPGIVLFALTLTFAAIDLLMSLQPAWYSTIFGVYYFSGAAVASLALLIVVCGRMEAAGRLDSVVGVEHRHDLGKLLFSFTFFWAYVAFSQYMLIWYANLPEETVWYWHRQREGWATVSVVLLLGHFILPFLGLLPRAAKRDGRILGFWAVWLLAMHWLDLQSIVMAPVRSAGSSFGLLDAACLVGVGGLWWGAWRLVARGNALAPVRDPRLYEALAATRR